MAAKKTTAPKKATDTADVATETKAPKAKAVKTTKKITFSLPAAATEGVAEVVVVGSFNDWDVATATPLKKQKDGSFKTTIELEKGKTYEYRFLLDGQVWANAWDAAAYVATPFGVDNSVVEA